MEKRYANGIILGRFQPFHLGHASIVEEALEKAERVLILVGSAQESRTVRNPYSFEERAKLIKKATSSRIIIAPLKDLGIGDVCGWGDYVIDSAEKALGEKAQCLFLGHEEKNAKWLSPERKGEINLVELSRAAIPISATQVRNYLLEDDRDGYQKSMREELYEDYDWLREILLSIPR